MKNVVITAIVTAVLVFGVALGVCHWAAGRANAMFDAKDAEIARLEAESAEWITDKQWQDAIDIWEQRAKDPDLIYDAEQDVFMPRSWVESESNIFDPPDPVLEPNFTDLVQTSLKGVVHLQAPFSQSSGFVAGPRLIVTARHCVEGVEDFVLTTHNGHQVQATRAISDKEHDVAFIWIDDLECVAKDCDVVGCVGGTEERTFVLGEHDVVLTPLDLGSIKDCMLGQSVYVIGSPYGKVNFNSLTTGIISGVDRDWGDDYGWNVAFTVDSAGHPGNSGCPVFTMDGTVRGILVGGFSPVLISVMPCDLFLADLDSIQLIFAQDRYEREETPAYSSDWYNYEEDNEYYEE